MLTEALLYYYKHYIIECKKKQEKIAIKPHIFYYLQPFFIYLYSLSFTHQSFLFTLLFIQLFYSFGKSGDLIHKNQLITYSNDISSYKIMKFFHHGAFHLIFYLKLFYYRSNSNLSIYHYKMMIFGLLQLFQLGMYIHKSYARRYDFIQQLKENDDKEKESQKSQLIYPSYYKIPILTNREEEIQMIVKKSSFFVSQNYYFYMMGLVHFFIYFFL